MIRTVFHAAEAVVLGAATIAVIGTCASHALRAKPRPPHREWDSRDKPSESSQGESVS